MTRAAAILQSLKDDPEGLVTDEALGLSLVPAVSAETVAVVRRKAGIPGAYARRRVYAGVRSRLARCVGCARSYRLPQDRAHYGDSMGCPRCGERIRFSAVELE